MTTTTTAPGDTGDATLPAPRNSSLDRYDTFVANVLAQCADPGTQQALRRGLAKPVDEVPARTHAALLRHGLVPDEAKGARKRAYYAVAALIAARPRAQRTAEADGAEVAQTATPLGSPATAGFRPSGTSLGESLALAVTRQDTDGLKEGGVESRLHLMVRQETGGLHRMLPAVLRQLGSAGVAADYACLLRDLIAWEYGRDQVATRWLEGFYRTLRREKAAATEGKAEDKVRSA
ncbi:type I-E CRISPR-associated protein Cse2/CasB [Streptomyces sp. NPDC059850]|uniref:type I-E CRISPR-associated protein Cse2/CasB n=1 Tax=Streptomyces sp. NPDC059850 TaxID=3346970 RepID=UPI0036558F83